MGKSIVLAILLALFSCGAALAAPSVCTLTGPVYDPTGAPLINASINFDSVRTQVIGGVSIGRVVKSINTDASGNLGPNQWTQMLVVSITICDQYGNCGAPFSAIIPNTATAQFGNMIMGAFITQTIPPSSASGQVFGVNSGNTPEWETLSGGVGSCSFVWNSTGSYTLNCPGYAPKASPTFTGTVTMPDAATWTSTGISSLTALGIGTAAPTGGTALAINRSFAGSALETITNSNTGTTAQAGFQASNGTSNALFAETGTAATGNPPANSLYLTNNGAGGMYISTTGGNYPIVFAPNGVQQGFFSGSGLTLAQPLAIASGGRGSTTAPTAGQIDVAQSATAFAPVTMSGDATLTATGAITVSKIGGITYGGAGTAGQVLIAQSASAYAPETMNGDVTMTGTSGTTIVGGLHFGSQAVPLATLATPPPANSIAYFSGTSMTASAALTSNLPIIIGAGGPTSGARSGNTTTFGTTAGTLIANDCVKFDANGNLVDAGGQCGISGGPTFPNGSPPQITGYSAANVSEAETVSGDFTFARAGLNSYVATVTKLNGIVPGGACAANTYVSSISASGVPTCGAALTGLYAPLTNPAGGQNNYAPIASPTFTGTVTFPDSSTHTATGLTGLKGLSLLSTATMTFPDSSTYTSAGHNNMVGLGVGMASTAGSIGLTNNQNASTAITLTNNSAGTVAQSGINFSNGTNSTNIGFTGTAYSSGLFGSNTAFWYSQASGGIALWNNSTAPIKFDISANVVGQFRSGGLDVGNVTAVGTDGVDVTINQNNPTTVMVTNGNAGASTQAGYGATNGVTGVNLWLEQTGPGYTASLGPNVGYLYADRKLALMSGQQDGASLSVYAGGNHLLDLDWGKDLSGFTGIHILPNTWSQFIEGPNGNQGISISSIGANNFNIMAGAYYNGTNWVSNSSGQSPLMNAGQAFLGFYRQPTTWTTPVGSNLGGWVAESKFDGSWEVNHVQSNPDVPAPTVTNGTLTGGSRDWAGEIIGAAAGWVTLTYSRCFPNQSYCVLTDDGQGVIWVTGQKGPCSVQFTCRNPASGNADCTAGNYVQYICTGS